MKTTLTRNDLVLILLNSYPHHDFDIPWNFENSKTITVPVGDPLITALLESFAGVAGSADSVEDILGSLYNGLKSWQTDLNDTLNNLQRHVMNVCTAQYAEFLVENSAVHTENIFLYWHSFAHKGSVFTNLTRLLVRDRYETEYRKASAELSPTQHGEMERNKKVLASLRQQLMINLSGIPDGISKEPLWKTDKKDATDPATPVDETKRPVA
jgi:hypothetical protein